MDIIRDNEYLWVHTSNELPCFECGRDGYRCAYWHITDPLQLQCTVVRCEDSITEHTHKFEGD